MSIAVLASGTGTILEALVEADLPIACVVIDRPCRAESVAHNAGIPVELVLREDFSSSFDRNGYTNEVVKVLGAYDFALIAMAGYGTILGPEFVAAYPGRILNTHPALLPSFKGWHPVRAALEAGVKVTGCTVHLAEAEVDAGPILAQEAVPVLDDDTEERLSERIKSVERRLYPLTIKRCLERLERGGKLA